MDITIGMFCRTVLCMMLLFVCSTGDPGSARRTVVEADLNVAAAISLKDALLDVSKAYRTQGGHPIIFNFGASGELAAQIDQGAPIDVFISAAQKQVDDLVQSGSVAADAKRAVVARNALVLIVPVHAKNPPTGFADLADEQKVAKIAIGQPQSVPAGEYAMQVFESLKIDEAVRPRLIYGNNVRQVLSYVERGEVSAGIVYRTDTLAKVDNERVKIVAVADEKSHKPIEYPAVVTKASTHQDAAADFIKFLQSDKAQAILKAKGFIAP